MPSNLRHTQPIVAVYDHCFATSHHFAIQQHLHGSFTIRSSSMIETAAKFQHLAEGQLDLPETQRNIQLHIHHHAQVGGIELPPRLIGRVLAGRRRTQRLK